jgi:HPt (histidine-containing phosphotransfer) domain-containing protein
MQEAIQEFVATLPTRIAAIDRFQGEHNPLELQRIIHQLKGAGGGYGFDHLTQLAADAEHALMEGDSPETTQVALDTLIAHVRSLEGYQQAHEVISCGS